MYGRGLHALAYPWPVRLASTPRHVIVLFACILVIFLAQVLTTNSLLVHPLGVNTFSSNWSNSNRFLCSLLAVAFRGLSKSMWHQRWPELSPRWESYESRALVAICAGEMFVLFARQQHVIRRRNSEVQRAYDQIQAPPIVVQTIRWHPSVHAKWFGDRWQTFTHTSFCLRTNYFVCLQDMWQTFRWTAGMAQALQQECAMF